MERTNTWLKDRLIYLGQIAYPDLTDIEEIQISFGRQSRTRLGSIRRRDGVSLITLTGYFRDLQIPEVVLDETIAHELAHYTHGFESPRPRLYRHPHSGGVITRELIQRGLGETHQQARHWLKRHWPTYLRDKTPHRRVIRKRSTVKRTLHWLLKF